MRRTPIRLGLVASACVFGSLPARAIECGATVSDAISLPGEIDAIPFYAEVGDVVGVTVSDDFPGPLDEYWELFAPDGSPVTLSDSSLPETCATHQCTSQPLPQAGTYTVKVYDFGHDETGAYDVSLSEVPSCVAACSNGVDDDGDTPTDFPADGCCTSADDLSEHCECGDGLDNDRDGAVDFPSDLGCKSSGGVREDPECEDGRNNDGDGMIDWDGGNAGAPDPQCVGKPWRNRERACGLGFELLAILPLLMRARGRRDRGVRGSTAGYDRSA
jgi:hypothetical protein